MLLNTFSKVLINEINSFWNLGIIMLLMIPQEYIESWRSMDPNSHQDHLFPFSVFKADRMYGEASYQGLLLTLDTFLQKHQETIGTMGNVIPYFLSP